MKITLLASTAIIQFPESVEGTEFFKTYSDNIDSDSDLLAHFAGRSCYQSWEMPSEKTKSNEGYISNIISQGHFSVLEHSSTSFYVEEVSRSLLAELTRHRHLSFSVVSQRYVDYSKTKPVYPPAASDEECHRIDEAYAEALKLYEAAVARYVSQGLKRKQAREAARAVLPNCAPVSMVVTGNLRSYRDMLFKRYSKHADAEICLFSTEILRQLKEVAPASFQDFPEVPFE